eukprot:scaffold923_cov256-Pinguiococcus_pyrenoidosus.AAC.51
MFGPKLWRSRAPHFAPLDKALQGWRERSRDKRPTLRRSPEAFGVLGGAEVRGVTDGSRGRAGGATAADRKSRCASSSKAPLVAWAEGGDVTRSRHASLGCTFPCERPKVSQPLSLTYRTAPAAKRGSPLARAWAALCLGLQPSKGLLASGFWLLASGFLKLLRFITKALSSKTQPSTLGFVPAACDRNAVLPLKDPLVHGNEAVRDADSCVAIGMKGEAQEGHDDADQAQNCEGHSKHKRGHDDDQDSPQAVEDCVIRRRRPPKDEIRRQVIADIAHGIEAQEPQQRQGVGGFLRRRFSLPKQHGAHGAQEGFCAFLPNEDAVEPARRDGPY